METSTIYQIFAKDGLNRSSTLSLIDLDASLPDNTTDMRRPSTADSDATSSFSGSGNTAFGLERHLSNHLLTPDREPSIYVTDEICLSAYSPDITEREPSIYVPDDVGFFRGPAFQLPDEAYPDPEAERDKPNE